MFGLRCLTLFLKIVGTISFCGIASFQFVSVSKYLGRSLHGSIHGGPWFFFLSTNRLECLFIEICRSLSIWMRNLLQMLEEKGRRMGSYDADKILPQSVSGRAVEWLVNKEHRSCLKWAAWRQFLKSPKYFATFGDTTRSWGEGEWAS